MGSELTLRRARAADRPAVERICAHTWQWGDYVLEVWDEWLADERGPVIVGEVAGQVMAFSKITWNTTDQVWLEGLRVDPDYRRRGFAGRFLDYCMAHAQEQGARVVRLSTGSNNTPVHNLMERIGMERIGCYARWIAEPLPDGPQPAFLTPADHEQVQAFLTDSPVLAHMHGLYCMDGAWQELSAGRVAQFLEEGRLVGQLAPDGRLAALAVTHFYPKFNEVWVDFVDGTSLAITELASAIRAYAAHLGAAKVDVRLADLAWLREAFRTAGYSSAEWDGELWIFERWLTPRSGDKHGA